MEHLIKLRRILKLFGINRYGLLRIRVALLVICPRSETNWQWITLYKYLEYSYSPNNCPWVPFRCADGKHQKHKLKNCGILLALRIFMRISNANMQHWGSVNAEQRRSEVREFSVSCLAPQSANLCPAWREMVSSASRTFVREIHSSLFLARSSQSLTPQSISLRLISILSSHICLLLPDGVFPSGSHERLCSLLPSPHSCCTTFPSHSPRLKKNTSYEASRCVFICSLPMFHVSSI
jgi:hypothetical protein